MAVLASQRRGLVVHHLHERFLRPGHMLCQRVSRLITGMNQQGIEAVLHGQLVSFCHIQLITAVGLHVIDRAA